ncbi:MAG: hypothetical protein ABIP49_00980, partial [Lysobacterales bacterium]
MRVIAPDLDAITQARGGEHKLGQVCWRPPAEAGWLEAIQQACVAGVRFVVLGVPEHEGVLANHGVAGAREAWECVLPGIANVQSNRFLSGADVWIAGAMELGDLRLHVSGWTGSDREVADARVQVEALDSQLTALLEPLFAAELHPIVVGGGNNNSLP